ncbi:MAG: D-alanine--D-alanine ligase [Planctomycetes bacterium]|nr:D-alanine--D-alanine ligase [Planctomycetota bacterium]
MKSTHQSLASATVAVLSGGCSSEREISLSSGAAVAAALRDAGDGRGPARVLEVEITASGAWRLAGEEQAAEEALARLPREVVFFLALHGGAGEDGTLQGLLAACGRRHTGSGVAASALCMTKSWTRAVLAQAGLAVAPGRTVDARAWDAHRERELAACRALSSTGLAVKPDRGGSSVATSVLESAAGLERAIEAVLAIGDRALVEARVLGSECTVGVLGGRAAARALTPVEIVPKAGRFFDYQEKYSAAGASEHCPPLSIDAATCARLRDLALRAHEAAGCCGYSRVDFIVPAAGGEPVVLEINTLPGMTARSLLPLAARDAGLSFRELCLAIVALALAGPEARP